MMPQTSVIQETQSQSTCETCPKFQDFNESNGRGWCETFDRSARQHHTLTSDCQQAIESEQLQELLDQYQAYLKPVINGFPGRDVYKQLPQLGYERIGYVSENLVGWFALNQHGLPVAERLPSQNEAVKALLDSFQTVESEDYRSGEACQSSWAQIEQESTQDFQPIEPEEDLPHSEFDDGSIVKVIDREEEHTEWSSFVVIEKKLNQHRFRSTQAYLNEPDWYYLLTSTSPARTQHQFWVAENEICHAHQSELIETAEVF